MAEAEVLPREGVVPCDVACGKHASELDVVFLVLDGSGGHRLRRVYVYVAVGVADEVDGGVYVAHRASFLQQEPGGSEAAHVEHVHREPLAGNRVHGVVGEFGHFVPVERISQSGTPEEVAP